jgi:K+-sensing histidine kinase KdpD
LWVINEPVCRQVSTKKKKNMLRQNKHISVRVTEPELKARNWELSVLLEMSNLLASSMDLRGILSSALAKVIDCFGLDAGRIYLMDDSRRFLTLVAHQGMEPGGLERVHISEGFTGKAARTKSFIAQHVPELGEKKRATLLLAKGFQVIICVPLIVAERVEGVMNLASRGTVPLNQEKIDLLTTMGNQIAVAANDARVYEELQNKVQALQEKKETITFFAYSITHDLKSPATSIYALTQRLKEKYGHQLDEKGGAHCEQIMRAAQDMVSLVDKLNAYVMSKEAPLHLERVCIQEVLDAVGSEFAARFQTRGVKWSIPNQLPEVVSDRLCLLRIFRNLVDNSLKYGGEELSEISVECSETEDLHILSVRDDGIGIGKADPEGMFTIFRRDKASRGMPGCGLGLAIVREAAVRHGGSAWMESDNQQGASVSFSISKSLPPAEQAPG